MALSMDEQRMLAEIEARLTAEDPRLAARMSSFRRPATAARLRTPRGRLIGSMFAVALALAISLMVYAMIPFRAHSPGGGVASPLASGSASAAAPVKPPLKPATATTVTTKTAGSARARQAGTPAVTTKGKASDGKTIASKAGTATVSAAKAGTATAGTPAITRN